MPIVLAADGMLLLAYYTARGGDTAFDGDEVAVILFDLPHAHYFGSPNDEAFAGHPLASRGLAPYGIFEVVESSWVRQLEKMNRVHDRHNPRHFDTLRHFIFTFHDDTFEVIAKGVKSAKTRIIDDRYSLADLLLEHLPSWMRGSSSMG